MIGSLNQSGTDVPIYLPQSGLENSDSVVNSKESTLETVRITDGTPDTCYGIYNTPDPTMNNGDEGEVDLADFLARPVQIAQFNWTTSVVAAEFLNPWKLFLENRRVSNRISNFKRFRGNLKVKFLITGNAFQYGRLIVSYNPMFVDDQLTRARAFIPQDVIAASQRPYIMLDPTTSTGGEFYLPFIWKYDALSVPGGSWDAMGELQVQQLNQLLTANGGVDSARVIVLAWCEDAVLSVPTSQNASGLSPQSGQSSKKGKKSVANKSSSDEYGTGIVSKPASLVAKIAGKLTDVPVIGPYARATSIAAGATANVASLFGYSRPANLDAINLYTPRYAGNMANSAGTDTCTRLTLDPKQEVTIDTRVMGLDGADELGVSSIASRQSYLTTTSWSTTTLQDAPLHQCLVKPSLYDTFGPSTEYHMTACCFATTPFAYWRGTMRFRVQVVASAYHRGRLKIIYDPYINSPLDEFNTQYTYIIDIAEERDFTVDIGWGSEKAWLRLPGSITDDGAVPFVNGAQGALSPDGVAHGEFKVVVMNPLTAPSTDGQQVYVNIFVGTGDDLEVAAPNQNGLNKLTVFEPQSGTVSMQQDDTAMEAQQKTSASTLVNPPSDNAHSLMVYQGECITSFRQVLKRYNYHRFYCASGAGEALVGYRASALPTLGGYDPNGMDLTDASVPYSYANMTLLNYITMAFVGYRGSIRYKVLKDSPNFDLHSLFSVNRVSDITNTSSSIVQMPTAGDLSSASARIFRSANTRAFDGVHVTSASQNDVLEFEIPYYSDKRFLGAKRKDQATTTTLSDNFMYYEIKYLANLNSTKVTGCHSYVAIGEDFQLGMYLGPPVFYKATNPVAIA